MRGTIDPSSLFDEPEIERLARKTRKEAQLRKNGSNKQHITRGHNGRFGSE